MSDNNNNFSSDLFKKRLVEARKSQDLTQQQLASLLRYPNRSKIANWESENTKTIPCVEDVFRLCQVLNIDSDYLLNLSEKPNEDDEIIANKLGLSVSSVRLLRDSKEAASLAEALLSSSELGQILKLVDDICVYGFLYEAMTTTFSPYALEKIERAFQTMRMNVSPVDLTKEAFVPYVKKQFPWKEESEVLMPAQKRKNDSSRKKKSDLNSLISSLLSQNEIQNLLFDYPDFDEKNENERYEIVMEDIAGTSFDYLIHKPIIDLARINLAGLLKNVADGFITDRVNAFLSRKPLD